MLPTWFRPLALSTLLVGWIAVIVTLVMMIKAKRAARLAEEAKRASVGELT